MSEIERLQRAYHDGVIAFMETSKRLDAVSAAEMQQAGIRFLLLGLREPSRGAVMAACAECRKEVNIVDVLTVWQAMIDHILNEEAA